MSEEAMDVGVEVKMESEDEVEPYDGTYASDTRPMEEEPYDGANLVHCACVGWVMEMPPIVSAVFVLVCFGRLHWSCLCVSTFVCLLISIQESRAPHIHRSHE